MLIGYFGDRATQCFRVYHPPTGVAARSAAVVLCNPAPQEYRQCHYLYRQLALRLADAGLHVLRFDYRGTGDSAGDTRDATLADWVTDIAEAATELRELSEVKEVGLVGIRLGAALAARAVAGGLSVRDLVLWDPVVHGAPYLAQLRDVHDRIRLDQPYPISDAPTRDDLLGATLTDGQAEATMALDLRHEPLGMPGRVWTVVAEADERASALTARYAAQGVTTRYDVVPDATLVRPLWHEDTLLARRIPATIVGYLSGSLR
jgi:alpha-beta hydrolase superfamily lysophospholipase